MDPTPRGLKDADAEVSRRKDSMPQFYVLKGAQNKGEWTKFIYTYILRKQL